MGTDSLRSRDAVDNWFERLDEIYANVPEAVCARCGECCGPLAFTVLEEKNIEKYLEDEGISVHACVVGRSKDNVFAFTADKKCPFIGDNGCIIYPVRPIVCRLFGVIRGGKDLSCKKVVCEQKLPVQYAGKLIKRVARLNEQFVKDEPEEIV